MNMHVCVCVCLRKGPREPKFKGSWKQLSNHKCEIAKRPCAPSLSLCMPYKAMAFPVESQSTYFIAHANILCSVIAFEPLKAVEAAGARSLGRQRMSWIATMFAKL